jgi:hypothetical protein
LSWAVAVVVELAVMVAVAVVVAVMVVVVVAMEVGAVELVVAFARAMGQGW